MRLIGSFQTITIQGRSAMTSSSVEGSSTSAGAEDTPPRLRARDLTHRVLGQRGDRQARVDADVGGNRGAVGDQEVLVAIDAVAGVDNARRRVGADDGAAEDVGGA